MYTGGLFYFKHLPKYNSSRRPFSPFFGGTFYSTLLYWTKPYEWGLGQYRTLTGVFSVWDIANRQLLCFEPLLLNVWGCCQLKFQCGPLVWDSLAVTFRELCPRDTKRVSSSLFWTLHFILQLYKLMWDSCPSSWCCWLNRLGGALLSGLWACFWVCLCNMALVLWGHLPQTCAKGGDFTY